MAQKTLSAIVKQRINTAAGWASANPVLQNGQIGVERDNGQVKLKVGDGVTAWNSLSFYSPGSKPITMATVASLENLPIDADIVVASIQSTSTISFNSIPSEGWMQSLFIRNLSTSGITIPIPTSGNYKSHINTNSIELRQYNGSAEILIVFQDNKFNLILSSRQVNP